MVLADPKKYSIRLPATVCVRETTFKEECLRNILPDNLKYMPILRQSSRELNFILTSPRNIFTKFLSGGMLSVYQFKKIIYLL